MNETIEQQIRQVLATATQAGVLSDQLFAPEGLFNQLAHSEQERRLVSQSPLFQQAQARLTELQRTEAAEFARTVEQAQATLPRTSYLIKVGGSTVA